MSNIKDEFIHIQTTRFLVEPNEDEEIVNEGMYGAALSSYLEQELNKRGYSGKVVAEDFGYWLGFSRAEDPKSSLEMAVYCPSRKNQNPMEYVVLVMTHKTKRWVWSKFKHMSFAPLVAKFQQDVKAILEAAPGTKILSLSDDMPE